MSPIERVRERVHGIREHHVALLQKRHLMLPGGGTIETICASCNGANYWPCATLKLAERMLQLAEALEDLVVQSRLSREADPFRGGFDTTKAERVLAECAEKV